VASADRTYADPSALLKLYIHELESSAMSAWRARTKGALPLTEHGRAEIINGICLASFQKQISREAMLDALASFDDDIRQNRYSMTDVLWRATLRRAADLSRTHTATIGCRSLDVLHVASAIELGVSVFVTFDRRQQRLAKAVGLTTRVPTTPR
jgi:predicted nucleic acid-binding protein